MVTAPYWCSLFKMEMASAAPSVGSVPAQSSSNRHRLWSSAFCKMRTILVMWEENVLRLCSILCSSPISAKISWKMASSERSPAGMCRPDCPIRVSRPTVFKETVFPPVFGPVTISCRKSAPRRTSIGTTFLGSKRGWRPLRILIRPSSLKTGATPL